MKTEKGDAPDYTTEQYPIDSLPYGFIKPVDRGGDTRKGTLRVKKHLIKHRYITSDEVISVGKVKNAGCVIQELRKRHGMDIKARRKYTKMHVCSSWWELNNYGRDPQHDPGEGNV